MKIWNWGIIGPGKIARKFADDLRLLPQARLLAVASRNRDRAEIFAREYGVPGIFTELEAFLDCPDLDVVYIATPHSEHCAGALACLERGIPVLCEKPMALDAGQVGKMVETARRHKTFLMEALWTCFIPGVEKALSIIEEGRIGPVRAMTSDFGFYAPFDPASRLFDKKLGGGALLDIGIYPVLLSLLVMGKPASGQIRASATFAPSGADNNCAFIFNYPDRGTATGQAMTTAFSPVEAQIFGEKGRILLHTRWHHTRKLTLSFQTGPEITHEDIDLPYTGWGYHFEAAHVMRCLEEGLTESPRIPLSFSMDLIETLDAVRGEIGLEY